jgi:hypothetical protein
MFTGILAAGLEERIGTKITNYIINIAIIIKIAAGNAVPPTGFIIYTGLRLLYSLICHDHF